MGHTVNILEAGWVTHNVRRLSVEKPDGYQFVPGQATDVAVDREGWRDQQRPFTFTSLNSSPTLEFTIKVYPDHNGVTNEIKKVEEGDRLLIDDPWGVIKYQGKGCFIAGGAGVTPFIAILRDLDAQGSLDGNTLIFSNRSEKDILLHSEFSRMEGLNCIFTVTDDADSELALGRVNATFLKEHVRDFSKQFYVCGPPEMVEGVSETLRALGANPDAITFEE